MQRMQLIEVNDTAWCPRLFRHFTIDCCSFFAENRGQYDAAAHLLADAIEKTGARKVLDLGSGGGGPWLRLQRLLKQQDINVDVCLSDIHPNHEALERARQLSDPPFSIQAEPVDGTNVPKGLADFRTMFSAFHHLPPEQARAMLADAVAKGEGIAVFECALRNSLTTVLAPLLTPFRVLRATPSIRPFRWSRLFWTYVIPVMPLLVAFDAFISCLRIYEPAELQTMCAGLDGFRWETGVIRDKALNPIVYLIGVPVTAATSGVRVHTPETALAAAS